MNVDIFDFLQKINKNYRDTQCASEIPIVNEIIILQKKGFVNSILEKI